MTNTLTRGRCAPLAELRPCMVRNPDWWTTGNEGNATAIMLCQTACRFDRMCPRDNPNPRGVIVAGTPYSDSGKAIKVCAKCGHPWARRVSQKAAACMCRTTAFHHDQIMAMRADGVSWPKIAAATGLHPKTIRLYYAEVAIRQATKGAETATPSEHHDQITALRNQGRTWMQVAKEIGCTPWALKGYVKRQRRRGVIAA